MVYDSVEHERDVLQYKLTEAESLLHEASSLLNSMHGYESKVYKDIQNYFDEEVDE